MEILIVSTSIVLISHVFIPILIMKDLAQIKKKLIENIREYQDTIKQNKKNGIECYGQKNDENFNAAKYLFISTGLSKLFPDVKESKIIAQFSTPWPKQSYCRVKDVSKQYSKKFSALTRSASILIIFFAGQFLNMPSGFQDVIIHVSSTTAVGYVILLHIQLYQLFPALVILPVCIIGIIVHFIITSGKADAKLRLAKLFPVNTTNKDDHVGVHGVHAQSRTLIQDELSSTYDVNIHQTRRASLRLGLNVIDEIEQIENSGSEESSSGSSDDNDEDSDEDDDDDDGSDDEDDDDDDDDGSDDENDRSGGSASDDDSNNYISNENENNSNFDENISSLNSVSFVIDDSDVSDDYNISDNNCSNNKNNINNKNKNSSSNNSNDDDYNPQNDVKSEHSSVDNTCISSVSEQSSIVMVTTVMVERNHRSLTGKGIVAPETNTSIWLGSISDDEEEEEEEEEYS